MNDSELARNYILDRLPEEDRDACERRFLFDPEFESLMLVEERTLLDDYVNLRLSDEDATAVLQRVAQEPGRLYRLRFAESLKRAAAAADTESRRKNSVLERWRLFANRRNIIWSGSIAAALAAAIFIAVTISHRTPQPEPSQSAIAKPPTPSPTTASSGEQQIQPSKPTEPKPSGATREAASMATFVLLANQQRGDAETPKLTLKPGTTTLRLQLTTEEGLDSGSYSAVVTDAQGANILTAAHLIPRTEASRRYIDLRIPAQSLPSGDYSVDLTKDSSSPTQPALKFLLALQH